MCYHQHLRTSPRAVPGSVARQLRLEHPGAIWHLISRGNDRRAIFVTYRDHRFFLRVLAEVIELNHWILHGYVLMNNHYHLIVETPVPTLSRGMKRLNEKYAGYFNHVHDRIGHLFQGRFKSVLVERESHLLELCRYVVLNPVRAGIVDDPAAYLWSSYRSTAGLETPPQWLDTRSTLSNFPADTVTEAQHHYREFVGDAAGVTYDPDKYTRNQIFLGGEAFRARMRHMVDSEETSSEIPEPQRRPWLPDFPRTVAIVCEVFTETEDSLRSRSHRPARKALAQICWEECGLSLAGIGRFLNITQRAVSHLVKRSQVLEATDEVYAESMSLIRTRLSRLAPLE